MYKPWEIEPALNLERLEVLSAIISGARSEVNERREEDRGDDNWVIGCRANGWVRRSLNKFSEEVDWLDVPSPGLSFLMRIETVSVRIATDDPYDIGSRSKEKLSSNPVQSDFGFPTAWSRVQLQWFIVTETDVDMEIIRIALLGILPWGEVVARHVLSEHEITPVIVGIDDELPPPYNPEEPEVGHPSQDDDEDEIRNTGTDDESDE